jgi:hypothetical protein
MADVKDFIHVYENVLDESTCHFLIDVFEKYIDKHERYNNNGNPNFTQFNLTGNKDLTSEITQVHDFLIKKTIDYRNIYYNFMDSQVFPIDHAFEEFRIKKYNTGGEDRFDTHVDVTNYASARRYLSFLWYLNDVQTGGNTLFTDFAIQPKMGSLLIFPPLWMFPHMGEPPISGSKYIMSTYLHYI